MYQLMLLNNQTITSCPESYADAPVKQVRINSSGDKQEAHNTGMIHIAAGNGPARVLGDTASWLEKHQNYLSSSSVTLIVKWLPNI